MTEPAKEYDFDPRRLPKELLAAIGLAITSAAQTERVLEAAIAGFAGLNVEYGGAITTHMSMPMRYGVLKSVAEIRFDDLDLLDAIDEHIKKVDAAFSRRNEIAHNQWCRDPEDGTLFMISRTARTRYEVELVPATVDQVKDDAYRIYQAGMDFMQFLILHGLLPSIPAARRARDHKSKAARKVRQRTTEHTKE